MLSDKVLLKSSFKEKVALKSIVKDKLISKRHQPGRELGTSRTLSENHATRPSRRCCRGVQYTHKATSQHLEKATRQHAKMPTCCTYLR